LEAVGIAEFRVRQQYQLGLAFFSAVKPNSRKNTDQLLDAAIERTIKRPGARQIDLPKGLTYSE
jgi:hypothetical protein